MGHSPLKKKRDDDTLIRNVCNRIRQFMLANSNKIFKMVDIFLCINILLNPAILFYPYN